jgi:hypothetical protein
MKPASTAGERAGKELQVKQNKGTYGVFTNNCSAMVIRGLLIGGAWNNWRFVHVVEPNPIMTPRVVKDAAEALCGSWSEVLTNHSSTANLIRDAYELITR